MKIISWNVNGFRAWMQKKNTVDFFEKIQKPEIFCLQEIKATKDQVEDFLIEKNIKKFETKNKNILSEKIFPDYKYHFWNPAERKGYSGTAIFSKIEPLDVIYGIGDELDQEGRAITLEFENFFLTNVYVPNSKPDLSRLDHRYKKWDKNLLKFLKKLEKKKSVVLCGDLNVAHKEIDLKNPSANKTTKTKHGNAGFTDKERERFQDFLDNGLVDIWRVKNPQKVKYSWWSYRFNARANNAGWRIDYFLISESIKDKIKKAKIYNEAQGSDHCPVGIEIKFKKKKVRHLTDTKAGKMWRFKK